MRSVDQRKKVAHGVTLNKVRQLLVAFALVVLSGVSPARALDPDRTITQFHHTGWTLQDGMPGYIRAIAQTSDGFLWLGTYGGLYRFDGVRVERMEEFGETRLPLVGVQALLATPDGDLWIGFKSTDATVSRVRQGKLTTFTQADGLAPGTIKQLVADATGGVWARTEPFSGSEQATYFDGRSWRSVEGDFGAKRADVSQGIYDIGVAVDGTVWAKNGRTTYYYAAGMKRFEAASEYSGRIIGFARGPDGRLWTADQAEQRFYALPDMSGKPGASPPPPTLETPVPATLRGYILIDRDGAMWCANQAEGGVSRMRSFTTQDNAGTERFTEAEGLTSNATLSIFEDREGNIWVGTNAGLDRFRPADLVQEPRVPLTKQFAKIHTAGDLVYVHTGTSRAPTKNTDGSSSIYAIGLDELPILAASNVGDVQRIGHRGNDLIYVTRDTVANRLESYTIRPGEAPVRTTFPPDWSGPKEFSYLFDSDDGTVWFPRPGVGYFRHRDGIETRIIAKDGSATARFAFDWRGKRWVYYTDGDFFEIGGEQVRKHRAPDFGDLTTADADDHRILFGGELGLVDWDGQRFRTVSASRIPALSAISKLSLANRGEVWLTTQSGVVKAAAVDLDAVLEDPNQHLPYRLFDFRDGLPGAPSADIVGGSLASGPDGRFWFTTANGLTWIDPKRLAHNPLPPPVAVTMLTVGERSIVMPANVQLPPQSSNLRIDYTALSLRIPERNRFRYKLDGVDGDWVDAGDRRQAFYTRLEPGTYFFRVIAANNDGVWNEVGATVSFTIAPTFLQSIWFKFLVGLAAAGLAWLAYGLRLRQQAARLQSRFDVRIAERERIARELHDTLLQSSQGLILQFQSIANRVPTGTELRGAIESAIDSADAVVAEGRSRVYELRSEQASGDLAQSIIDVACGVIRGDTPRFSLTVEGDPRRLHALVGEECLRIAEEAIRNATLHASARHIVAILTYGRRELRLTITDDGVGMPEAVLAIGEKAGHYGLIGMRERAHRMGGRLNVKSREGAGAEISVSVRAGAAYKERQLRLFKRR